jgi:hypothetical protein
MPVEEAYFNLTIADYSAETSGFSVFTEPVEVDGANWPSIWVGPSGAMPQIIASTGGIIRGVIRQESFTQKMKLSNARATDPLAQREDKLLVTYQDNTTLRLFQWEVPTVKIALLDTDLTGVVRFPGETDEVYLDKGGMTAWVADMNTFAKSPAGNAITILRAVLVGRNI